MTEQDGEEGAAPVPAEAVAAGNAALARGDWAAARAAFERALAVAASAEACEGLSWAALALDDGAAALQARQEAYRLYREGGDDVSAARMAMWAAKDHEDFRGEHAVARGWRQRARRLLEGQPTVPEHGWLALFECWASLDHAEDPDQVRRCANEARAVADARDEPDVAILALAAEGLALVGEGRVDTGMTRLDEAAAAVLGGELRHDIWALPVFCWLIYACERVRDFGRAAQWCARMQEAATHMQHTASQGICRAHYASVLTFWGRWDEAESALTQALADFAASWPPHTAEPRVRMAELRRRQGRPAEAAELLESCDWHPLAMLARAQMALDAGRAADAGEEVERFLRHIPAGNRVARGAGQELMVHCRVEAGELARASEALVELEAIADAVATSPLRAAACHGRALVARGSDDGHRARACLEDAVALYERSAMPFEAALVRLELAAVLGELQRWQRAREEALAARRALDRLGADGWVQRAQELLDRLGGENGDADVEGAFPPLTPRQTEVLVLVAAGRSDAEIAAALGISRHTVHRHVANILLRLDVSSRAAAAAQATSRGLLRVHGPNGP